MVDPKKNKLWRGLRNHIKTDDVHLNDQLNYQSDSKGKIYSQICFSMIICWIIETLSEAIKILKGEYCLQAIDRFKMDRALIFCRTKLDCDNLERYFIKQGGGKKKRRFKFCFISTKSRTKSE
jgi:ATP-dependent RNA helicase DDX1